MYVLLLYQLTMSIQFQDEENKNKIIKKIKITHHIYLLVFRWERRVDPRGRVYYVDHNTRTTTWQRPNPDMINNLNTFQQWRTNRNNQMEQLANRFLYPQQQQQQANDPLGDIPEGWGMLDYIECLCFNLLDMFK